MLKVDTGGQHVHLIHLLGPFTTGGGGEGHGDIMNHEGCQIFVKTPFLQLLVW